MEEIGASAFEGCTNLEKVYLSYAVTTIEKNAFNNCPSLTIWTEYASYALQYAKGNGIRYYYLTPDGVNSPSGTLYRGDSYALYGYARASVNLTEVTATIWNGEGAAVKQVSVNPAVTDYNLAGTVNTSLTFGDLALGSYRYTLTAKTDVSEEVWADNRFTIVPPPLRIYASGINVPDGLVPAGQAFAYSGVIQSNYAITGVAAQIKDISGSVVYQYNGNPGSVSFNLNALDSHLPVGNLNGGAYTLTINVTANGETRNIVTKVFEVAEVSAQLSEEDTVKILQFARNSSNRSIFNCEELSVASDSGSDTRGRKRRILIRVRCGEPGRYIGKRGFKAEADVFLRRTNVEDAVQHHTGF